jgi:hypothetical protein
LKNDKKWVGNHLPIHLLKTIAISKLESTTNYVK